MRAIRSLFMVVATLVLAACEVTPVDPVDQPDVLLKKGAKPGGGGGEVTPIVFRYVEAGDYRGSGALTCGLDDAGKAYCWGYNPNGWLGIGSTRKSTVKTPQPVLGDLTFSDLTVASKHICGISDVGALAWCWGVNAYGQAGAGSSETVVSEPAEVVGGRAFSDISAGGFHTCGVGPDGYGYCWGWNYSGQLGDGTTTDRNEPVAVIGGLQFARIFAGGSNSCGILESGDTYCWGDNEQGQLGIGTLSGPHVSPVLIPGGRRFESLAITDNLSKCGLTSAADPLGAGHVMCWGNADNGGSATPTGIDFGAAAADLPFRALVGRFCAIGASDQAYCWGENDYGQIGNGEQSVGSAVPLAVGAPGQFELIGGKGVHACGVGSDGYAYCWGWNTYGELGDGTTRAKNSPVRVAGQ